MMLCGRGLAMGSRCRLMVVVDVRRTGVPRIEICVITVGSTSSETGISGSGPARVVG
jgi:hypothetical protein